MPNGKSRLGAAQHIIRVLRTHRLKMSNTLGSMFSVYHEDRLSLTPHSLIRKTPSPITVNERTIERRVRMYV